MVDHDTSTMKVYDETLIPTAGVPLKRISWSAVFAGVVISIVVYLLLIILGTAIGAGTVDPLQERDPLEGIGTGAAIWTGLSMLISAAIGGYASGRLAQREGGLHGLLMFGVNTLIFFGALAMFANTAMTGAMSVVGSGLQTVGNGLSAAAPPISRMVKDKLKENNINLDNLQNELEKTLQQTGKPQLQPDILTQQAQNEADNAQDQAQATANHPQTANGDLKSFMDGLMERNESTFQAADRDALKNIIKARTGKSDAEAEQIVNQTERTYQATRAKYEEMKKEVEQKAREAGEKAAAATAKAAWFTFFMLIVQAVLASLMGVVGRRTQPRQVTTTTANTTHHHKI